jgi:GT2 family glycosyltransferase
MNKQYVSPLSIRDGFAYGWATRAGQARVEVHLWMDGRHVATEYTGNELPLFCHRRCGQPSGARAGFVFPLPAAAFDGFTHELHAGLPGNDSNESLHGEVQPYEHGRARGEVRQHGRQFIGTVWFKSRSSGAAQLEVKDARGRLLLRHPLAVSGKPDQHGYPAQFAVACDTLPEGPLHFSCRGQALRGSPCSRRVAVVGLLEAADANGIRGWAFDGADIGRPLELCLRVDGRPMVWFRPNIRRPEIEKRLGHQPDSIGLIGFLVPLPEGFADGSSHRVEVVAADDGQPLSEGHRLVRVEPAWIPFDKPRPFDKLRANGAGAGLSPSKPPLVSVIVLNRNGERVLAAFLESWARHNTSVAAEVIVIDHASSDGSLAMLHDWAGRMDLRVIALDHNGSFSASSNLGARHARGDYLLFMNNDIVWLHDALPRMLESLREPDVGIVGLKLLKAVGESGHALQAAIEVQHLGVRFKLNELGYWPYEVAPSALRDEQEYAPQVVPAVTGAALLCRKSDFEAAGGFDAEYFYGFEDIELCLRLSQRLRKRVVSRNDACALHRHGHTRLSGRDMSLYDRVQRNSVVLESHAGLWLKQAYWRSLLQGDGYMTTEALTIGLVVDGVPSAKGNSQLTRDALALAARLHETLPHARVVFLPPERGWKNAADLHVLVIGTPEYDVRAVHNARADLLTVAWVRSESPRWPTLPWWLDFGGYLSGLRPNGAARVAFAHPTPSAVLGDLIATNRWRLRVAVQVPLPEADLDGNTPLAQQAFSLMMTLKQSGLPCWRVPLERWGSDAAMADVCVVLLGGAGPQEWTPRTDVLNVLWLSGAAAEPPQDWQPRHGRITREPPTAAWLQQAMEESIGNTFRPS